jgi:hypothetical protein
LGTNKFFMARKKNEDYIRTITKIAGGKSFCVTLPIAIVRDMNWDAKTKVCVKRWGKKIIIRDFEDMEKSKESC